MTDNNGMVAMTIAALHKDITTCLILIDTGYKQPHFANRITNNTFVAEMIKKIIPYAPKAYVHGRRDFSQYINTGDWNVNRIAADILHSSLRSYFMLGKYVSEFDGSALLKKIQVPTLIIEGTHDSIFPPEMAEELHSRIVSSEIEYIPGANHILVTSNPTEVTESISKFIQKLDII
jgi:pimeloyl-ACP methyl ester carboxylesterase